MLTGLFFLTRFYWPNKLFISRHRLTSNLAWADSDRHPGTRLSWYQSLLSLSLSLSLSAPSDSRFNLWLLLDRRRRWRCSTKFMGLKFSRVRRKISISAGKKLRMFEASANNRDWITVNYTQTVNQSESSPASRENIRTNQSRVSDLSDWETRSDGQDGQRVMMEQLLMCQTQSGLVSPVELPTSRHHLDNYWDLNCWLPSFYLIIALADAIPISPIIEAICVWLAYCLQKWWNLIVLTNVWKWCLVINKQVYIL